MKECFWDELPVYRGRDATLEFLNVIIVATKTRAVIIISRNCLLWQYSFSVAVLLLYCGKVIIIYIVDTTNMR